MEDLNFLQQGLKEANSVVVKKKVVLVEDDEAVRVAITNFLKRKLQYDVYPFAYPRDCLEKIDQLGLNSPFCLLTDMSFDVGGQDGLSLIDAFNEKSLPFFSLVITGFGSIESAVAATKRGVFHYLTKPFSLDVLSKTIDEGFSQYGHRQDEIFCGMIGRSPQMHEVFERIKKVANSDATILITGPSGTGKELVANAIHQLGPRNSMPFIPVNCGSIPKDLLESELFGHLKGSFTGAITNRKGRFELADSGTLFLDEIGDMPFALQVKLLRVLQKKEIEPIGGSGPIKVDVRIIAATHRDLEKLSEEGHFREDLFYRLNVIPIKIPSLSSRKEDIPLLINFFLDRFVSANNSNKIEFGQNSMELLMEYDWPGNVRELENLIERLVILRGGNIINPEDLPARIYRGKERSNLIVKGNDLDLPLEGVDLKNALNEIEKTYISQAMMRTHGNKNQAAKLLGLNRTTLIEKIKKYEMQL